MDKNEQLSEKENPWNWIMTKTAFLTDNWAKIFYKRLETFLYVIAIEIYISSFAYPILDNAKFK